MNSFQLEQSIAPQIQQQQQSIDSIQKIVTVKISKTPKDFSFN